MGIKWSHDCTSCPIIIFGYVSLFRLSDAVADKAPETSSLSGNINIEGE